MERKLIKQGIGGCTVYLPKKWLDQKKLGAGDSVRVEEENESLVISSRVHGKRRKDIRITEQNRHDLKNILTHCYRKGFDILSLHGLDNKLHKELKDVVNDMLLGFEIVEKNRDSCVIENISEPDMDKYDSMMRRVFLIIRETHELIVSDMKEGYKNSAEINDLMVNHDRYVLFCRRMLSKERVDADKATSWELLSFLMHIEHAYRYMHEYMKANKYSAKPRTLELMKNLDEYFGLLYDSYYKKRIDNIHKLNVLKKRYQFGSCINAISRSGSKDSVVNSYIREIFRLVQIASSPVLSELLLMKV